MHATCALVSETAVLSREVVEISGSQGLGRYLPRFAEVLRRIATDRDVHLDQCLGLVVGFCGLVNCDTARVLSTNQKYEDAPGLDFNSWARESLGVRLRLENDARLALLGERAAGAGAGYDDIVMMTLGTGIGGAAMMGGKLVRGKHYQAGCLGGHFAMNPRGWRCTCGAIGCAESEASTWALPSICASWPGFAESRLKHEKSLDFAVLFRMAAEGDAVALEIVHYSVDVWAALTVSLIHAYDPEIVIVGGGVMRSAERILPAIRKRVEEACWTPWGKVKVLEAQNSTDTAALMGAIPLLQEVPA